MKYIKIFTLLLMAVLLASCGDDIEDGTKSIFPTTSPERNEFDNWILKNYTEPYNIDLKYLYNDKETDQYYNVIPADYNKAVALAIMVKHIWLDAYTEVAGEDFIKKYTPRVMQLIGSAEYNGQGNIVLGTAEGGLKVTLFRVNALDVDNPVIDTTSPFPDTDATPIDLNYWFFHTMHHEFCHILTQQKNYSTDFQTVSAGKYQTTGWVNVDDDEAPTMGFVSGYASGEYNEDFAELFSTYITHTAEAWNKIVSQGEVETYSYEDSKGKTQTLKVSPIITKAQQSAIDAAAKDNPDYKSTLKYVSTDTSGRDAILSKLQILRDYFEGSWGLDLDALRTIVLRRSLEVKDLDLKTLK